MSQRIEVVKARLGSGAFFAVLTISSILAAAAITISPSPGWCRYVGCPHLPPFCLILLFILICLSFALGHPQKPKEVTTTALLLAIPGTSVVLTFLGIRYPSLPTGLWHSLIIWNAIALLAILPEKRRWKEFLLVLAVMWTLSTEICLLGESRVFPYARQPLARIQGIHILFDLRVLLGAVFLLFYIGTAVSKAVMTGPPDIKALPLKRMRMPNGGMPAPLAFAMTPLIYILNLFSLIVLNLIPNLIWKVGALFCVYAYFTAREGLHLGKEVFSKRAVLIVARVCFAFVLSLALVAAADRLAPLASAYLLTSGWRESWSEFGTLALNGLPIFFLIVMLAFVIYWRASVKDYALSGPAYVLLAMALAGLVLWISSLLGILNVVGFSAPGPFTTLFLMVLFGCLVYLLAKGSTDEAGSTEYTIVDSGPGWITTLNQRTFRTAVVIATLLLLGLLVWWIFPGFPEMETGHSAAKIETTLPASISPVITGQGRTERLFPTTRKPSPPRNEKPAPMPAPVRERTSRSTRPKVNIVKPSANVYLSVKPDDASVLLDGRLLGRANWLQSGITVYRGTHRLEVSKEGYLSHAQIVNVDDGKNQFVEIKLEREGKEEDEVASDATSSTSYPNWSSDRDAARNIRDLEIVILYTPSWYAQAKTLEIHLKQLGGRVTRELAQASGIRQRGIYFSQSQIKAANALKKIAEDNLHLFLWERNTGPIVIYLVDPKRPSS